MIDDSFRLERFISFFRSATNGSHSFLARITFWEAGAPFSDCDHLECAVFALAQKCREFCKEVTTEAISPKFRKPMSLPDHNPNLIRRSTVGFKFDLYIAASG
jgi:hypothetical protein